MNSNNIIAIQPLGFPWECFDPFLFCAHHRDEYPQGNEKMGPAKDLLLGRNIGSDFTIKDGWRMYHGSNVPGFPYHPHRGFETITINKEGFVDHTDSLGASGRFGAGDVQWMTAGKGVQHSEMFPLLNEDKPNPLEIFQVWLNLPAKDKMVEPHFKMLWNKDVPVITEQDDNGNKSIIDVIAGNLNNIKATDPTPNSWAANPNNDVLVLTVKMEAGAELTLPKGNSDSNRTIYFYKGDSLTIEHSKVENYHMVRLQADQEIKIVNGNQNGYFLLLQGKPIGEPVAKYGPFVMNTQQEIMQAMQDYQQTQFGGWPWPEQEQTHPRDKERFALHADGKEEIIN